MSLNTMTAAEFYKIVTSYISMGRTAAELDLHPATVKLFISRPTPNQLTFRISYSFNPSIVGSVRRNLIGAIQSMGTFPDLFNAIEREIDISKQQTEFGITLDYPNLILPQDIQQVANMSGIDPALHPDMVKALLLFCTTGNVKTMAAKATNPNIYPKIIQFFLACGYPEWDVALIMAWMIGRSSGTVIADTTGVTTRGAMIDKFFDSIRKAEAPPSYPYMLRMALDYLLRGKTTWDTPEMSLVMLTTFLGNPERAGIPDSPFVRAACLALEDKSATCGKMVNAIGANETMDKVLKYFGGSVLVAITSFASADKMGIKLGTTSSNSFNSVVNHSKIIVDTKRYIDAVYKTIAQFGDRELVERIMLLLVDTDMIIATAAKDAQAVAEFEQVKDKIPRLTRFLVLFLPTVKK